MTLEELQEYKAKLELALESINVKIDEVATWQSEDIDISEDAPAFAGGSVVKRFSFAERTAMVKMRKNGVKYHDIAKILNRNPESIKGTIKRECFRDYISYQGIPDVQLAVRPSVLKKVPTKPSHIRAINLYYTKQADGSWYTYKDIYRILLRENYDVGYSHNQVISMLKQYFNVGGRDKLTESPFKISNKLMKLS